MENKVKYAIIGGVALITAAVAFHFLNKTEDEECALDDELNQLGSLELDEAGRIEFKQFLKIFQICTLFGKKEFAGKKKELVMKRREALANKDEKLYSEIVMSMTQEEEMLVQNKLMNIIEKLGVSEESFQGSMMFHFRDQHKQMQIMQMQQ
jgi:hypothetical protein